MTCEIQARFNRADHALQHGSYGEPISILVLGMNVHGRVENKKYQLGTHVEMCST